MQLKYTSTDLSNTPYGYDATSRLQYATSSMSAATLAKADGGGDENMKISVLEYAARSESGLPESSASPSLLGKYFSREYTVDNSIKIISQPSHRKFNIGAVHM